MLKHLEVTNFKAWRRLRMPFGKVTGLFGENSSGKSSVLQFLLLLKQTKNATDRGLVLDFGGPTELVNLGRYQDLVHQGDASAEIDWALDWSLPNPMKLSDPMSRRKAVLMEGDRMKVGFRVGLRGSNLSARFLKYRFADTDFTIEPKSEGSTGFNLKKDNQNFTRNPGRGWALPGPVKTHLFPDQARTYYQNTSFLSHFEAEYESLMDRIFYLGPLRDHPQREYRWSGASPADVGPRGEHSVDAILAATERNETRNLEYRGRHKTFQGMIAHWLQVLGLIDAFEIREIAPGSSLYQARVRKSDGSPETMLTDVGFGVSQVLPVLVLLYYVPEGSIVLMEQPEIHLHPSVQSGLADVMLAVAAHRGVQIIVESHSEHLLRRFQRRAAEGNTPASDLKLYFVSNDCGVAELNDLELNEWGQIEKWPDRFFGDEMEEITAISKASLKRRIDESR
ncbi:MAG: DUF3696 domain-containing protein [Spirochaetaceae bacterium]|nr:DUF3696 domain-containing protein [Spirochaetaceae bacterium]